MLKLNCVKGMKVTTTGKTAREKERKYSNCCEGERTVGYVTLGDKFRNDRIEVEHDRYTTEFYFEQIHPYWGDK